MATDIVMPNLGFDTQEGRLVEWLKQVGDSVQKGEAIAVVESDKANVELESVASGVLLEQIAQPDEVVHVGAVIARVGTADERPAPVQRSQAAPPAATEQPVQVSPVAQRIASENNIDLSRVQGSGPRGRITREDVLALVNAQATSGNGTTGVLALPKVRRAAREAGIDLADVPATGGRGQVTMADLEGYRQAAYSATEEAESASDEGRIVPLSRTRQIIGERLGRSVRKAPHFYVSGEFDLGVAIRYLAGLPEPVPRINDLLQYVTVQSLKRVPELNATFRSGELRQYNSVNLAVAVALDDGLITPVIARAERYSLTGLATISRELIQRARNNRLQAGDLQNGTFTISNLGVIQQVDQFTAVINPPQVAILAVGTVKPRPAVIGGGLHVRPTVHLTLSGDHRVVDGMHLGRFMAAFQDELKRFR